MKKIIFITVSLITFNTIQAQFVKSREVNAQIGLGFSAPSDELSNVVDQGFFLQGEYVMNITSWFDLKPYAGLIITNSKGTDIDNNPTTDKATSKAFLIGGKGRLRAPIPWVAPYLETGIGASIGSFETVTLLTDIKKSGFIYHIPLAIGLELGPKGNVDLGFAYYFQPSVEQFAGAFAVGITFPLN